MLAALGAAVVVDAALNVDALTRAVSDEKSFQIINNYQDLPDDAKRAVRTAKLGKDLANLGEPYAYTQAHQQDATLLPGQHLFSGVSAHVFIVIWRESGPLPTYQIVASYRGASEFCRYAYVASSGPTLLAAVQEQLVAENAPTCKPEHVRN